MTVGYLVHLIFDDLSDLLVTVSQARYSCATCGIEKFGTIFQKHVAPLAANGFLWDKACVPVEDSTRLCF